MSDYYAESDRSQRKPGSYEGIEWSAVNKESDGTYWVRHEFRAKNGFGGYVVYNMIFYLDSDGI